MPTEIPEPAPLETGFNTLQEMQDAYTSDPLGFADLLTNITDATE